jgi:uncharacterized phage protein (TIGR01671 family)
MRILKFRAWNKKSKEFQYFEIGESFYIPKDKISANQIVIQQYAGIDKKGKEAYEGDLLEFNELDFINRTDHHIEHFVLIFKDGCFILKSKLKNKTSDPETFLQKDSKNNQAEDLSVIGNICENPELLKKLKLN